MGLLAIGLAVSAASTVVQAVQARKSARARKEAQAVSTAGENIRNRAARRRAAREERVRRASLIQASENGGTEGSSGEIGALASIGSSFGAAEARQRGSIRTAEGISAANQKAADATSTAQSIGALSQFATRSLSIWDEFA